MKLSIAKNRIVFLNWQTIPVWWKWTWGLRRERGVCWTGHQARHHSNQPVKLLLLLLLFYNDGDVHLEPGDDGGQESEHLQLGHLPPDAHPDHMLVQCACTLFFKDHFDFVDILDSLCFSHSWVLFSWSFQTQHLSLDPKGPVQTFQPININTHQQNCKIREAII